MNEGEEMSPIKSGGDHDNVKRQKMYDVSSNASDESDYHDPLCRYHVPL